MVAFQRLQIVIAISLAAGFGAPGCSQSTAPGRPHVEGWSQRHLAGASYDQALDASVYAMRQWFTRVDADSKPGLVRGLPMEYTQKGGTDRIHDSIGYHNRLRRIGTIEVHAEASGCVVRCVVERQRLDNSDMRVFRPGESGNDLPNRTPIERDAGLSREQQDTWTDMPRDRALERDILAVVLSRASGTSTQAATESATGAQ